MNFIFIRHGESCQNLAKAMYSHEPDKNKIFFDKFKDPTLSDLGVSNSILAGKQLKENLEKYNITNIDFIFSSPMIRAIETAYFMTHNIFEASNKGTQNKIIVAPFLREITSKEKYNNSENLNRIFSMKSVLEQEYYFKKEEIIKHLNFDFVRNNKLRECPGNIKHFITWFNKIYNNSKNFDFGTLGADRASGQGTPINVLVFLHSAVIKEYSGESPYNNNGFIIKTQYENGKIEYHKKDIYFHTHFNLKNDNPICPTNRCPGLC